MVVLFVVWCWWCWLSASFIGRLILVVLRLRSFGGCVGGLDVVVEAVIIWWWLYWRCFSGGGSFLVVGELVWLFCSDYGVVVVWW
jgi:hypothetical protein